MYATKNWTLLAFIAGLFEGEGTVTISGGGAKPYTRLIACMANTNRDLVEILQRHWPATRITQRKRKPGQQDTFEWRITSHRASLFLLDIQPFALSDRMARRIALGLRSQAARQRGRRRLVAEYRQMHEDFRAEMRVLNRRGKAPAPEGSR